MAGNYEEQKLFRRERQIMEVIYQLGKATVAEISEKLPQAPTSGAIRRMLNILEQKNMVKGEYVGPRKVYTPVVERKKARSEVLNKVVKTFFGGSSTQAIASIIENDKSEFSDEEKELFLSMMERAKKEGR